MEAMQEENGSDWDSVSEESDRRRSLSYFCGIASPTAGYTYAGT